MVLGPFSPSAILTRLWTRHQRHEEAQSQRMRERMGSTKFFGSQVGGQTVINYAYTDLPSRLMTWDIYYFFYYSWALPWIVLPLTPSDSGDLDELAVTPQNIFCIALHLILFILQLVFVLSLPAALFFPIWMAVACWGAFLVFNWAFCLLLNGPDIEYHSDEKFAEARPEHAHEQWVFLNGVAVGDHWMKNNLNRLALTFQRPILGIHNQTSGIIFDVFECLIQRNFGYVTYDVRMAYRILKDKLYDPQYSKVIFVLHSQGGIEGGLVLDWLLQELPQDLLSKIEVYTFGNAANHFNNPHRHVFSQALAQQDPAAAVTMTTTETTQPTPESSPISPLTKAPSFDRRSTKSRLGDMANGKAMTNGMAMMNGGSRTNSESKTNGTPKTNGAPKTNGEPKTDVSSTPRSSGPPSLRKDVSSLTSTRTSTAAQDRALGHVEHYAHTTDFVALWGVLHFCTSLAANRTMPRYIGRLFVRASERGGHQFCQHYLDGMFPLERDPVTNKLTRCAEENEFMESEVQVGTEGAAGQNAREAFEISWLGDTGFGSGEVGEQVEVHGDQVGRHRRKGVVKVKDLSRLWMYRNGMSPPDGPPLLIRENGIIRNATM
ncbi:hypothetical protein HYQ44_000442 [Verticillium longisporum]|nr:hypothetical protein HYQ44_000442 [Verticillium longisporum]